MGGGGDFVLAAIYIGDYVREGGGLSYIFVAGLVGVDLLYSVGFFSSGGPFPFPLGMVFETVLCCVMWPKQERLRPFTVDKKRSYLPTKAPTCLTHPIFINFVFGVRSKE